MTRGDKGWKKEPFPYLWVVMFRYTNHEDFKVYDWQPTRKDARAMCRSAQFHYGDRNVYVQKYGPIS